MYVQAHQTVAMASLVVADPSLSHFKITLWREAAEWAERITAGDIVVFYSEPSSSACYIGFMCVCVFSCAMVTMSFSFRTGMRLKLWRGEVLSHTTMTSRVLNLHQIESLPDQREDSVPGL